MRRTLLFSALESIEYNQNRKNLDLKLFEFGKSYHLFDSYIENQHLFLSFTGLKQQENWNSNKENIDFYYVKEYVHTLLERLNISKFKSKECSYFGLSQAMIYSYKGKNLVEFGSVDQNILDKFKIRTHVFVANFNWDLILDLIQNKNISYTPVNKFPKIRRDLSLLIDNSISFEQLQKIAKNVNSSLLKDINLFDVYSGDKLPENKKSYAISFVFEDNSKTLTDHQVDEIMNKLIEEYKKSVGAEIR